MSRSSTLGKAPSAAIVGSFREIPALPISVSNCDNGVHHAGPRSGRLGRVCGLVLGGLIGLAGSAAAQGTGTLQARAQVVEAQAAVRVLDSARRAARDSVAGPTTVGVARITVGPSDSLANGRRPALPTGRARAARVVTIEFLRN